MRTACETALVGKIGALETIGAVAALRTNVFGPIAKDRTLGRGREFSQSATRLPVHFIYHVPKCAGQTIDGHLAGVLSSNAYYRTRKRKGVSRFWLDRHDFRKMPGPDQIRVVGGHFLGVSIEPLFTGRELRRSMLLRDPVSHLISYYNFRMMRYLSQGLHPYSFELAYGATKRNFITHYILRNFLELSWSRLARFTDDEKYDTVNAFLATFWYVGDYTLCDDLIAALAPELGISGRAAPRNTRGTWERRVGWNSLDIDDLSSDTIAQIRQENLLDQRLWETWHAARHDSTTIRPRALGGRSARGFVSTEAMRFVNQIARRIQRRWRPFEPCPPKIEVQPEPNPL